MFSTLCKMTIFRFLWKLLRRLKVLKIDQIARNSSILVPLYPCKYPCSLCTIHVALTSQYKTLQPPNTSLLRNEVLFLPLVGHLPELVFSLLIKI